MITKRYGRGNYVLQYMDYQQYFKILKLRDRVVLGKYYTQPFWLKMERLQTSKNRKTLVNINRLPYHSLRQEKSWMPGANNLYKKSIWSQF